jgi:hypothetical protein
MLPIGAARQAADVPRCTVSSRPQRFQQPRRQARSDVAAGYGVLVRRLQGRETSTGSRAVSRVADIECRAEFRKGRH